MALFTKSVQTSYSHSGFKSVFNSRSLFFCCLKSDNENSQNTNCALHDDSEDEKVPDLENDKMDGNEVSSQEEKLLLEEQSHRENSLQEDNEKINDPEETNSQAAESELKIDIEDEPHSDHEPELEVQSKPEEFSLNDDNIGNETPEGNTISTVDDFDNISDHELNVVATVTKAEKKNTGDLKLKICFEADKSTLVMTIVEARDFARPSSTTNTIREHIPVDVPPVLAYSVHILIIQMKKHRYKTKMRQGPDPFFDEIIKVTKVNQEEMRKWILRFRLYGSLRNSMKQVIGEGFLPLDKIELEKKIQCHISLMTHDPSITEDAMNTLMYTSFCKFESTTSLVSLEKNANLFESEAVPEIQLGLAFNFSTGRLTIEIKRGNKFPKLKDNKIPDTFIKVILYGSKGEEMFSAKTTVKKSSCEPVFEESFIFQIFMFQLDDVALTIQGFHKLKLGKKLMFGTFTIGSKGCEGERLNHWKDLLSSKNSEHIDRWHPFDLVDA